MRSTKQPPYFSFYLLQASINMKNDIRLYVKVEDTIISIEQALR